MYICLSLSLVRANWHHNIKTNDTFNDVDKNNKCQGSKIFHLDKYHENNSKHEVKAARIWD